MAITNNSMTVATRLTPSTVACVDRIAAEINMTRGHVMTILILDALGREDEIFDQFRASARRRRGG